MVYLPIDDCEPSYWNPNEMQEPEFLMLVDEIKTNATGFIAPIQVTPLPSGKYRIIGGEHRWLAARAAEMEEVPAIILSGKKWEDEDLQKFVTVRLNVIHGQMDPEKFLRLYEEMAAKYGAAALQTLMGYTDSKAFQKLVGDVKKGLRRALPKELQDEFAQKAKDAKTLDDLQRIIQTLFSKFGDTLAQSYMVFTYGKQEHIYVQMDRHMKRAMDKIVSLCKHTGMNINDFLGPVIKAAAEEAVARVQETDATVQIKTDPVELT